MKNPNFKLIEISVDKHEAMYTAKNNKNYNLHIQTQIVMH